MSEETDVSKNNETKKLSRSQLRRLKKKANKKAAREAEELKKLERLERQEKKQSEEENIDVEIEYVSADVNSIIENTENPEFAELAKVFEKFTKAEDLCNPNRQGNENEDENDDENAKEYKEETESKILSRKQKKKLKRLSVAELKQLVARSDVVEAHDVTSADPRLLVCLKAYRNTIPVPRHWCHKRKYLQGKRGVEKQPFLLPDYIANTGIADMRGSELEDEEGKKSKTKARERVQPKMGRMNIDYQVLHDAFFRYQTKPKMGIIGDLYYEGKEFEVSVSSKCPGILSEDLKQALGMTDGVPPPWLLHMQRYGPPPSYPKLKIPGLNAPIPPGASFGYHPGGWGKPPVNEQGIPLYGDVFGHNVEKEPEFYGATIQKEHWGELIEEEEEEEEEEEQEEEEEEPAAPPSLPDGTVTPMSDGFSSVASGLETPGMVDLRKGIRGTETPETPQQLYQVLQQTQASVGGSLYGSTHGYVVPGQESDAAPSNRERGTDSTSSSTHTSEDSSRNRKRKAGNESTVSTSSTSSSSSKSKKYKDFKF